MLSKKREEKKKEKENAGRCYKWEGRVLWRGNSQRKSICQPTLGFLIKATQTHGTITTCVTLEHANFFIRHLVNQIAEALCVVAAFVKSYEAIT